jgi:MFS family permease
VKMFMIGILGQAVTPFVALALVPNFHIGWRLLFAIGALIGLAGVLFALRLPESPRRLVQHGRFKEAEDLVGSMEQRFDLGELAPFAALPSAGPFPVSRRALRRPATTRLRAAAWASCCTDGMAWRSWP